MSLALIPTSVGNPRTLVQDGLHFFGDLPPSYHKVSNSLLVYAHWTGLRKKRTCSNGLQYGEKIQGISSFDFLSSIW